MICCDNLDYFRVICLVEKGGLFQDFFLVRRRYICNGGEGNYRLLFGNDIRVENLNGKEDSEERVVGSFFLEEYWVLVGFTEYRDRE